MNNGGLKLGFFFTITAIILALADAYIVFGVIVDDPWWAKLLFMIPSLVYGAFVCSTFITHCSSQSSVNLAMWLTLAVFFPTLAFVIISLAGLLIGLIWTSAPAVFNIAALAIILVWECMVIYGIAVGWKKITVESFKLDFPDLPAAFRGYKIVHLSDFHIGTYVTSPETVRKIVDKVNELEPDLIVFTGDLVNRESSEIEPFINDLQHLHARDGILSVLGNHDYCLYRRYAPPHTPENEKAKVVGLEERAGWKVLNNEAVEIERGDDRIAVVGVENAGSRAFPNRANLPKALASVKADDFKILLSHDPTHWRREVVKSTDISLTLAGHTHGMQFKVGRFTPSRLSYREWGGIFRSGNQTLVVSTGVGGNVAFRFGIYPQIVLLTLE